jgi:NADH-quinone oxidoreductase subunit N
VWLALIAAANAVLGVAVYTRWLRPIITSGTPEGALAPELPVPAATETAEGAETAETPEAVQPGARRPARFRVRLHAPVDRVALMFALVVASVVLVAVSVQPDLLLALLG